MLRRVITLFLLSGLIIAGLFLWLWSNARADPIVRRATIELPRWPKGARPVTVALLSDIHIGSSVMDAARLTRIVRQVNALKPDLVLIAGDFVAGQDPQQGQVFATRLTGPLSGMTAPLGTVAVLGNHDYWTDPNAVRAALEAAKVTLLENGAVARGPLAIVGVGDAPTGHASLPTALAALRKIKGAPLILTHSPDLAPNFLRVAGCCSPATPIAGRSCCPVTVRSRCRPTMAIAISAA